MTSISAALNRLALTAASLLLVGGAAAQVPPAEKTFNPVLRRHWNPSFDIKLADGASSEEFGRRCWSQAALDSYVTQGRFWTEENYGLPYGYAGDYCLREQLAKINSALTASYASLLRSRSPAERRKLIASERAWIVQRNRECNVKDGVSYVMLGSFVCLMNMTDDRLTWIKKHR